VGPILVEENDLVGVDLLAGTVLRLVPSTTKAKSIAYMSAQMWSCYCCAPLVPRTIVTISLRA
jgi:hypothetical protein